MTDVQRVLGDPRGRGRPPYKWAAVLLLSTAICVFLAGCSKVKAGDEQTQAAVTTVGVNAVSRKPIMRQLTISSELVPDQEIDVYAKEAGYVKTLLVDYGSRVEKGQLMAVLEAPELELALQQDKALIQSTTDQVTRAEREVDRLKAQAKVYHLEYSRLAMVAKQQPGLVAQQEVDDAEGKDLSGEAQVAAGESALATVQSQLDGAKAKLERDEAIYEYLQIKAPFAGVVTQRYANLGTLMSAGTNSSTQALPLVKLSEDDKFRLVIPVPESYVKYIRIGDPVQVRIPSLDKVLTGQVKRFSVDVAADTRTMHTEVELLNPNRVLIPGVYAEATLTLERKNDALVVPLQAVNQTGDQTTIFLVDPDNKLQERKITLGLQTANDAEVLAGLNEGDRVVVSDRSALKAGMEVKPQVVQPVQAESDTNQ